MASHPNRHPKGKRTSSTTRHPIPPASNLSHRKVKQNSSSSSPTATCPPAAPTSNLSHRKGKQTSSSSSFATCPPAAPASNLSHRKGKQTFSSSSTATCSPAAPASDLSHRKGKQTSSSPSTATCPLAASASNLSHRKGKQTSSPSPTATCPPAAPASNLSHQKGKQTSSSSSTAACPPAAPASNFSHQRGKQTSSSSSTLAVPAWNLSRRKGKQTSSSSSTATCPPAAPPSSSSVDHPKIKYDVFLSFRGTDTRSGFLSHLLEGLAGNNIDYFVDDKNLKQGDEISSTLLNAIKESAISLVLFSKDYAYSTWCLEELEQILQCRENQNQIVMPIFYKVDPSTVRHQTGRYKKAFNELGKSVDERRLQKWQTALKRAANLSGFHFSNNKTEAKLIREIVERVLAELRKRGRKTDLNGFVGIHEHIQYLETRLHTGSQDILTSSRDLASHHYAALLGVRQ